MILICHRSLQLCLWFIKLAGGGGGSEEEGSIKVHNNKSACIAKKRIDTRTRTRTRTRSARTSTCSDCLSQEEEDFFWPIKVLAHGFIQHSSPRTTQTSFEQTEKNRNFLFQNFQNKFQFFFLSMWLFLFNSYQKTWFRPSVPTSAVSIPDIQDGESKCWIEESWEMNFFFVWLCLFCRQQV